MKKYILTLSVILVSGLMFGQNQMKKCNKLTQEEQKICKDDVIANLISDYVVYPENAMENLNEGTVYVRLSMGEQDVESIHAFGKEDRELSKAALDAVEQFSQSKNSALLASNEVYLIPVRFELD